MSTAILFFDVVHPDHLPLVRATAERGFLPIMNATRLTLEASRAGLPFRAWESFVPADVRSCVERETVRIAEGLAKVIKMPAAVQPFSSPLGNFLPHTGEGFFHRLLEMVANEVATLETLRALTRQCDLGLIVLGSDNHHTERALVRGAAQHGIRTLQLAQGIYTKPMVRIAGELVVLYSDCVALPGSRARDLYVDLGNSPHRIFITGAPHWDPFYRPEARLHAREARRRLELDPDRPTVLFCGSYTEGSSALFPGDTRRLLAIHRALLRAVREAGPDVQLIVRPHPSELARFPHSREDEVRLLGAYTTWLAANGVQCARVTAGQKVEAIRAADVVVSGNISSIIPEVMILGRPVIVVPFYRDQPRACTERDGIVVVHDEAQLPAVLTDLLGDPAKREAMVRRQNAVLPDLNYRNDGRATERVADLIAHLAESSDRWVNERRGEAEAEGAREDLPSRRYWDRTAEWIEERVAHPTSTGSAVVSGDAAPTTAPPRQAAVPASAAAPAVLCSAILHEVSGYAEDARNLVLALDRSGVAVRAEPLDEEKTSRIQLPTAVSERLEQLAGSELPEPFVHLLYSFPPAFFRLPRAIRNIGRTFFETDRLARSWAAKCNEMDEVWVASDFNMESFSRAGVAREKLRKVPSGIHVELYDPALTPLPIEGLSGFVFLSVFDWSPRKGWDVLLRAFVEEFRREEEVTLALKVHSTAGCTARQLRAGVEAFIRDKLGRDPARAPRIVLLHMPISVEDMPRLYRAANAYVMASRGEGFGRPYMEAMAMGLPTIGTRWSGNLDFMTDDNSYLIDCTLVDVPKDAWAHFRRHRWAEPSAEHLRALMRRVVEHREEATAKGARARAHILAHHNWDRIAAAALEHLRAAEIVRPVASARRGSPATLAVAWEGAQLVPDGRARVNRELELALMDTGRVELTVRQRGKDAMALHDDPRFATLRACYGAQLGKPVDCFVRHVWPPYFDPPEAGHWVVILPWEYGAIPAAWLDPLERLVDEVWVPSNFTRQAFIASGVSPERVAVVPYGAAVDRFRADAPPLALPTTRRCKFLFVGATGLERKGADVLLRAYREAFSRHDDVCLVFKDSGPACRSNGDVGLLLRAFESDPEAPKILFLTDALGDGEMPGLYTACDALVQPFRGESFGLPVAEALACGLPVIVTRGGACDDFCPEDATYWLPAERRVAPLGHETAGEPWMLEPDAHALAAHMRAVYEHPQEARARGAAGVAHARQFLGWERAASIALERLGQLRRRPMRRKQRAAMEAEAVRPSFAAEAEALRAFHAGQAHAEAGRLPEAKSELNRALNLNPNLASAHYLLGYVELEQSNVQAALRSLRQAVELAPDAPDFHSALGVALHQAGEQQEAEAALRRALELDGQRADVWGNLGELYEGQGRRAAAAEAYERALALAPDDEQLREALGRLQAPSGGGGR